MASGDADDSLYGESGADIMKKKGIIIVSIWEGLGNQLFQYAYARLLKEKGFDVRLDLNKTYDDYFIKYRNNYPRQNNIQHFNITVPILNVSEYGKYDYLKQNNVKNKIIFNLAKRRLWKYKFYEEPMSLFIDNAPCLKGNYYVKAWFQDEKYVRQIRNILLKELTPKKKIRISRELRQVLEYDETVSLHVRRGDFVKLHKKLPITYFTKAVTLMKDLYRNPIFLIFSEDLEWVKRNLNIGENCIYVNEDRTMQDYEELLIMSKCKSNIISNSTFSWWGAWLNCNAEKTVIAPQSQWSPKQKNIILKDWITI